MLKAICLDAYMNVRLVASEFRNFDELIGFINWYTNRIQNICPHSIYICINNYYLKDELAEYRRDEFTLPLSRFISYLTLNC